MNRIYNKFLESIRTLSNPCDVNRKYEISNKIGIALSGGVDSIVLLNLLNKYQIEFPNKKLEIHAITIDHGLREESKIETIKLNQILKSKYNNDLIIHKILKIKKTIKLNQIEQHARELRYELMFKYCNDNGINDLFLGHHLDDQIETFLMRLKSNSTIFGLVGMKSITPNNLFSNKQINLIRPLLNIGKDEIYKYARDNKLNWFEDYTNKDINLTFRNKIRYYLRNNEKFKNELIELHSQLNSKLNNIIYNRMKDIYNNSNENEPFKLDIKFDKQLLSLKINLKVNKVYYDNLNLNWIDYLVLDRILFNQFWIVSPARNYLYKFTKFDNKYSTIINNGDYKKIRSLSETIFEIINNNKKGNNILTLCGCLIKWELMTNNNNNYNYNIKINVFREHKHLKDLNNNNNNNNTQLIKINENNTIQFLYDNRVFIKLWSAYKSVNCVNFNNKLNFEINMQNFRLEILKGFINNNKLNNEKIKQIIRIFDTAQIPVMLINNNNNSLKICFPTIIKTNPLTNKGLINFTIKNNKEPKENITQFELNVQLSTKRRLFLW